jgi:hypothetical protein
MSTRILPNCFTLTMRRSALAAIGIGLFVLSTTESGADLRTDHPSAVDTAPAGRYATPARPIHPPVVNARTSPAFVDRIYRELMDWTPPPCLSGDKQRVTTRPTVRTFVFQP